MEAIRISKSTAYKFLLKMTPEMKKGLERVGVSFHKEDINRIATIMKKDIFERAMIHFVRNTNDTSSQWL